MINWKHKSILLTNGNLKYTDLDSRRLNAPTTGTMGTEYLTVASSSQELFFVFAYQPAWYRTYPKEANFSVKMSSL